MESEPPRQERRRHRRWLVQAQVSRPDQFFRLCCPHLGGCALGLLPHPELRGRCPQGGQLGRRRRHHWSNLWPDCRRPLRPPGHPSILERARNHENGNHLLGRKPAQLRIPNPFLAPDTRHLHTPNRVIPRPREGYRTCPLTPLFNRHPPSSLPSF